jgi:hypothetical protein
VSAARVRVWRAPALIALASALGLGSALVADGAGDVLGWLALATPALVALWYVLPGVQRARRRA